MFSLHASSKNESTSVFETGFGKHVFTSAAADKTGMYDLQDPEDEAKMSDDLPAYSIVDFHEKSEDRFC